MLGQLCCPASFVFRSPHEIEAGLGGLRRAKRSHGGLETLGTIGKCGRNRDPQPGGIGESWVSGSQPGKMMVRAWVTHSLPAEWRVLCPVNLEQGRCCLRSIEVTGALCGGVPALSGLPPAGPGCA